jgi:5-methyltetrahydrofolate--homocysteine methyltransferase
MIKPPHTVAEIAQWLAPEFSQPMRQNPFLDLLKSKVVVFDGGMGTQIFARNLTLADFWDKENCTDVLVLSRPDVITDIHADYYAAGADIVETDTFGASPLVLAEFGLADRCFELNVQAVQLARNAAARFTDGKPRFVAGSMGPGTKSPTLGQISFADMHASYYEQARGLLTGGVDVLLVETCFDLLQAKIAAIACLDAMRELRRRVPLMVQVTMETTGTMLLGTEMTSALTTLCPLMCWV